MRTVFSTLALILGCVVLTGLAHGKSSSSVTLTSSLNPSTYGSSVTFTATVSPSSATGKVTFKNGTATLGTVTISGGIATYSTSTLPAGSDSITAAYGGDTSLNSSTSLVLTQTVNKAMPTITWTTPAAIAYGAALSAKQLNAKASVAGTFVYSPASGTVLVAGMQTLSVTFTPTNQTDYTTATGAVQLTVNQATPKIAWAKPAAIIYGTALSATQLDATANVAGTFVYSPAAGTVPAAGTQTLSVTFSPADTTDYTTATGTASLTVNKAPLTVTAQNASRPYGAANPTFSDIITGFVNGDTQSVVSGAASLTTTATTSSAPGAYPITATVGTLSAVNYTFSKFVKGTLTITKATPTITWATPAAITYPTALSATQLDATASVAGTFVYSPAAGTVLAAGTQALSVTFTPTNQTDYTTATGTVQLLVNEAPTTITWATPAAITYGTVLSGAQLDATANAAGTFVYSPPAGTVLGAGAQTLSVTFTPTNTNYAMSTGTVSLTVNRAQLTVTAQNASRAYAAANPAFSDTITGFVNGDTQSVVSGTPSLTSTATTSSSVGSYPITAALGTLSAANYTFSTFVNGTLTITQATPAITWATPAAIPYGTALNGTQLDATANAAGTFAYSPAAGTVLAVGTQTLSVAFTPTDTTDYTTATDTVQLLVNPVTTSVTVISSQNPSNYGSPVTFTATVAPATATGTVTFAEGSTTLGTATISGGAAAYSTSALSAGSHPVTAAYSGDSNDGGSTSSVLTQTVQLSNSFAATSGQMESSRYAQTATQLTTGQILIAGGMSSSGVVNSAELYSLSSQTFSPTNAMNVARWLHTATLLNDGTVLIAGGSDLTNGETLDSAEIFNPTTEVFTLLSNTLNTARVGHTATLLNNGQVLIVGGYDPQFGLIADAELYDPPAQTFIDLGDTHAQRYQHTATVLQNGQVLIAGGDADPVPSAAWNTAEIFDLPSQTFIPVPVPMTTQREGHAAILLNNGQVLITGGDNPPTGSQNSAEIYDPLSNTFTAVTATMTSPRVSQIMTVLNGGKVLIMGGAADSGGGSTALSLAELYDPVNAMFTPVGNMTSIREHQTASLLNDGTVLETGGTDGSNIFNTADLYMPSQLNGLASIAITPATSSIGAGARQLFTAVGTFNDSSTQTLSSVLWSSSSAANAPISGDATNPGVAAGAAQGTTTITASAAGVSGSATLTVTAPTLASIAISPQDSTIPLGATQQFAATGFYTDGSTQDLTATATWSSSATVVAVINGSGLAAGEFQGTATIQASFGSMSASTTLSVGAPSLVSVGLTPANATIAAGSSQQYQATGTYSDGSMRNVTALLTWSSGSPAVAAVTNTGLATGLGQGTAVLTAGFESVSASVTLTVGPPNLVSITVVPNTASLSSGTTQQLSATGIYSDGSTQNLTASSLWASSNSSIVGISSSGLATAAATGNATITATSGSASGTATLIITSGTTQANLNTSRYLHSSTLLNNGEILVSGGVNCPSAGSCTYLNSAELYNPATSTFAYTAGPMATARSAPSVLLNNGKVLVAGGYSCDGSGNCSSLASAEIYDPSTSTFSSGGSMTVARSGHTTTLLGDGTVLIAGGEKCTSVTLCSALSSAEIYNPIAGTFTASQNSMSAARFGATAVLLNSGSVLITGGFDGANFPAAVEIYNLGSYPGAGYFNWSGAKLNVPRFDASSTLLNNGKVLVTGGSTCNLPGCPTQSAEIYDPVANTFSVLSNMNVARFNHTATLLTNGDVVVAGGYSSCGSTCTGDATTEFFDPVAGTFSPGQSVATALANHTGTLLANGNVLLVGGINAGVTLASDEWYQPISLTPPGLLSLTVAPASLFLMPGQTQQLVATGAFNDGSTQTLQSVIWNSSNPSAADISNSPGSSGIVNAKTTGATTLTATAGEIGGSASLSVAGLVSLAITPANPSIAAGSGQQLAASGTFADSSVHDVTSSVTWSSSNASVVVIGTIPGSQGFAAGASAGTATITATQGSVSATTSVTVQGSATSNVPSIVTVLPPTGVAGTTVTISGSGFGSSQGSGSVLLGSTYGTVVSWMDQQIVATVASISTSGVAQVQQGGVFSNTVPFNVNTATILNVNPPSGVPGTRVTITGSGFGATQGSGQVWLGTANGAVQSWSDGQIIALVANGATSGNALVLQNGVMSNSVLFAVNSLNIGSIAPTSGGPGTLVTITGTGFGANQGNGLVWLGGTNGDVMSWTDTQVVAVVSPSAMTGVVRVEQNGVLSNALSFTVPTSGGNAVTLIPNMLNLMVGQTQTLQALDANSQPVAGLTWTSSNPKVVSLSTDDPPVLTALTTGHIAITAGTASADVTVLPANLPLGTVIWSNPGNGSGVTSIVPAVPSSTGVADVFAFQADGTVQAITSSGSTAWTASLNGAPFYQTIPDFQGGLVVANLSSQSQQSITKLDGLTGQPNPAYIAPTPNDTLTMPVVHTDGTIFTVDTNSSANTASVVGIDPKSGSQLFSVDLDQGTTSNSSTFINEDGSLGFCYDSALPDTNNSVTMTAANVIGSPIIAGDGYAYFTYEYQDITSVSQITALCVGITYWDTGGATVDTVTHLMVMRVGSDGSSSKIKIKDWDAKSLTQYALNPNSTTVNTGAVPSITATMITNADQGTVLGWEADTSEYCASTTGFHYPPICNTTVPAVSTYGFASTIGGSLGYSGSTSTAVFPVLQAQDGSYFGTDSSGNMIRFTQFGNTIWSVPNDHPQIATADGGVIGSLGVTYDNQGRATGQMAKMPMQSWTGNGYTDGPVDQVVSLSLSIAASYVAFAGGNASGNGTATQPVTPDVQQMIAKIASGYVGSQKWLDTQGSNKCNIFVKDVLEQAGTNPPGSPSSGARQRIKYYLGLADTPVYPALAGDWANPSTVLKCWKTVTINPGNPPLAPGTLPPDISIPGDVIAEAINYSDATGHVGIIVGSRQTASADSAAPCFPPYGPAGIIDISDYGFRPDNWVDPFKNSLTGQPCRTHGKERFAVVKRFVCQ